MQNYRYIKVILSQEIKFCWHNLNYEKKEKRLGESIFANQKSANSFFCGCATLINLVENSNLKDKRHVVFSNKRIYICGKNCYK